MCLINLKQHTHVQVKGSTDQSVVEDNYSLEESLIDNLLNFAVTPKVRLLLTILELIFVPE